MLSELARVLFDVMGPIAAMAAIGFLLHRSRAFDIRSVTRVVFYVLSPCLVYNSLLTVELTAASTWRSLAFAALFMAAMAVTAYLLARRWQYGSGLGAAFIVANVLLNNGNYGLPLNLFAFGREGFGYAVILYLFNTMVGTTVCVYLLAHDQYGGARLALRRTLTAPVVWATALGLLSRAAGFRPPDTFMQMIEMAGRAAIPVFLLVLGMSLAEMRAWKGLAAINRLTALRMLGGPGLAIVLARLVGLSGTAYASAVLQASMPTAINTIVLSNEFEAAPDFIAGAVFVTTLASLITIPALLLWLR